MNTANTQLPGDVGAMATRIARELYVYQEAPVIGEDLVMQLTGRQSQSALYRWLSKYAPRARCGNGMYNKERIFHGLRVQAGEAGKR